MLRGDLTNCLVHLTRGPTRQAASETFLRIMQEQQLRCRAGLRYPRICFSEAPIAVLAQVLAMPAQHGVRYAPFGVMVTKRWLFERGGRPVIYQPDAERDLLHEDQKYRHVRYEMGDRPYDFTWEREWRVPGAVLGIDPESTTLVVPTREWETRFMDAHAEAQAGLVMAFGDGAVLGIQRFLWHFVVLADLGVDVDAA